MRMYQEASKSCIGVVLQILSVEYHNRGNHKDGVLNILSGVGPESRPASGPRLPRMRSWTRTPAAR